MGATSLGKTLIDITIADATFKMTEEGAGAAYCFMPERPEATDTGADGMVAEMREFAARTVGRKRLLDVGALFGVFSLVFTSRLGTRAVALEPSPWAFPILGQQIKANPEHTIDAYDLFASDKKGITVVGRDWKHVVAGLQSAEMVDVVSGPIDSVTDGFFDTIKIDVEGYETQVLRGARKLIERCKPLIFLEIHTASLPSVGESLESLLAVIDSMDYRVHDYEGNPPLGYGSMTRVILEPA